MVDVDSLKAKLRLVVIVGSLSDRPEYVEAGIIARGLAKKFKNEDVDPLSAAIVLEFFSRTMAQAGNGSSNSMLISQSYLFASTAHYLLED